MSTGTIEVVPVEALEELLNGSPPCQAWIDASFLCGKPSVARITVTCPRCGTVTCFLCFQCLLMVRTGRAICWIAPYGCGGRDFRWIEC